ncbi:MAG: endopeptidase La, partial [Alphaproteobacteria bacterium]|nr:endopeptidase La [Alphaproteobacteria bacterium]
MSSTENQVLPVLPLRDIVVFPHMIVPLFVGREKSVNALGVVMNENKEIFLVSQKDSSIDDPATDDVYTVGTISTVLQLLKLPDGTVKVLVEGKQRAKAAKFIDKDDYFEAEVVSVVEEEGDKKEQEALSRTVLYQFEQYVKLNKKVPPEVLISINQIEDINKLADTIASHLALKVSEKQELLELESINKRLERIYSYMENEISVLQVEKKIRRRVKRQMDKSQREYYLNEQMKAIQKELGDQDDSQEELDEIEDKIETVNLSTEATEKAYAELKKLRNMNPMSAEASVVRTYLDWLLSIPWKKNARVNRNIKKARKILDEDHFGLEKVKERILEYLAVQQRTKKVKGPILCLVGPPGVGKTSLGRSIARATGRNFVRASLGGMRDEAEIRGHRRTYVGSLPGKIIQNMKKAKVSNPLFLLDELDKLGSDWRGDPSSALLEVLDPEQNKNFNDHYLELDYDLSDILFITTANTLYNIPGPLQDRMEIIHIPGYTEYEKERIAHTFLIPKQLKENGLESSDVTFSKNAILSIIRYYTRESGVRNLEREISSLLRKIAKKIVQTNQRKLNKISAT